MEQKRNTNLYKTLFSQHEIYIIPEKGKKNEIESYNPSTPSIEIEEQENAHEELIFTKPNLIILSNDGKSSEEEISLLRNILKAVNISLEKEVDLVELSSNELFDLDSKHLCPTVISFSDKRLSDVSNFYEPFMMNEAQVLMSKSLSTLLTDKNEKSLLWKALKKMFEV